MGKAKNRAYFKRVQQLLEYRLQGTIYYYFNRQEKVVMNILFGTAEKDLDLDMTINSRIAELDEIWDKENEILVELISPTTKKCIATGVKSGGRSVGKDLFRGVENRALIALDKRANRSEIINDTTYKDIKKTLGDGLSEHETMRQLEDRVKKVYNVSDGRAKTIARTETGGAINEGTFIGLKNGGIEKKQWIGGTRPKHAAQDGEIRDIDEAFSNGQKYPGDGIGGAAQNINCRCTIGGVVDGDD